MDGTKWKKTNRKHLNIFIDLDFLLLCPKDCQSFEILEIKINKQQEEVDDDDGEEKNRSYKHVITIWQTNISITLQIA